MHNNEFFRPKNEQENFAVCLQAAGHPRGTEFVILEQGEPQEHELGLQGRVRGDGLR